MKRFTSLRACFFSAATCLAIVSLAHGLNFEQPDKAPPDKAPMDEAAQTIDRIESAYQMIDLGRRTSSPEVLLAGAVLLHQNPTKELVEKIEGAEKVAAPTPKALLVEAKALRPKDKALADYIAKLADDFKEESRGAVNFKATTVVLAPNKQLAPIVLTLKAKEATTITVSAAPRQVFGTKVVQMGFDRFKKPNMVKITDYNNVTYANLVVSLVDASGAPVPVSGYAGYYMIGPFFPANKKRYLHYYQRDDLEQLKIDRTCRWQSSAGWDQRSWHLLCVGWDSS